MAPSLYQAVVLRAVADHEGSARRDRHVLRLQGRTRRGVRAHRSRAFAHAPVQSRAAGDEPDGQRDRRPSGPSGRRDPAFPGPPPAQHHTFRAAPEPTCWTGAWRPVGHGQAALTDGAATVAGVTRGSPGRWLSSGEEIM